MVNKPALYLISGTPGSGKTSVARELMKRFEYGVHIPLDDLREWVVSGFAPPVPVFTEECGRQFFLARTAAARTAQTYLRAGFAVAVDDVLFPSAAELFGDIAAEFPVHKVLLRPRLEIALRRNAERTSKPFDTSLLAETIIQLHGEMEPPPFLEMGWRVIDSSEMSLEQTVDAVLSP